MVPIPDPEQFDVSLEHGFLPPEPPLERFFHPDYACWEDITTNLQGLILSKRLHEVVDKLPVRSTEHLATEAEWRRAYCVLAFIVHAYIWGGNKPAERVPPPLAVPFLATCRHLELPPVATYAGVCLWNWKPIFDSEHSVTLANLDTLFTFTGSIDEKWFYLVSVAIEARGAITIPLMLRAIEAANNGNRAVVTDCLRAFAERLDELGSLLMRMYDNCDPHVFYHRIRPFLAGSKNMATAGLPNGVIFDDGGPINKQRYVQHSGGSNAQSSIIQFFDIVLDVEHHPTGTTASADGKAPRKKSTSFIRDMRRYMPGPHARFLEHVSRVANLRAFVREHSYDRSLTLAFDACLAMLSVFRDKHIQIVSRYIIIKSREAQKTEEGAGKGATKVNLAHRSRTADDRQGDKAKKDLKGTGGTSLIPFLRQARNETGEAAIENWTRRLLSKDSKDTRVAGSDSGKEVVLGLAGVWLSGEGASGGLCHF